MAVGTFDGVHLGHRYLLRGLVRKARAEGVPAVVLTFEPHPLEVLDPPRAPARLTLPWEKADQLEALGIDRLVTVRFDLELAGTAPLDFADRILGEELGARFLHVGYNFTFGAGGAGRVSHLQGWGRRQGVEVRVQEAVAVRGMTVSSTAIREALAAGRVGLARHLLGRPYAVCGEVVAGDGRGRQLGFPTANLSWPRGKVLPAPGVYAVWARALEGGQSWPGMANFGFRPTFGGQSPSLEVHLFGFRGDLYGAGVQVHFWRRLRAEHRFATAGDLVRQLQADAERARRILGVGAADGQVVQAPDVYRDRALCYNRRD